MGIVLAEGFDDGVARGTGGGNNVPTVQTTQPRAGTRSLRLQTSSNSFTSTYQHTVNNLATLIVSFAWYAPTIVAATETMLRLRDAGTSHVELRRRADGKFEVARNGTVLGAGTFVYSAASWVHLQLKVTISDTVGTVELRINGSATPDITLTGQDTRNGANAYVNQVLWTVGEVNNLTNQAHYVDDAVLQDTTGSAPENDWLGDVEVAYLFPSAVGDSSGWTVGGAAPAATRHESLDEASADDATTTVDSNTVTDLLLMNYEDFAITSGTVYAVVPLLRALKASAGAREIRPVAKLAGTTLNGTSVALSTSWLTYQPDVWHRDPAGNVWTGANVNTSQFGAEVTV